MRSLALIIVLPLDTLFLIIQILMRREAELIFATSKWPDFTELCASNFKVAYISSPDQFLRFRRKIKGLQYIPAGPIYVLSGLGFLLPAPYRDVWSRKVTEISAFVLRRLFSKERRLLIVHSDALPFARSLVLGAKNISAWTLCIQHGYFSAKSNVAERDGSLCKINIVRSHEDYELLERSAESSEFLVSPDFFLLNVEQRRSTRPRILFLGEGHHIVDEEFNNCYLSRLREIYDQCNRLDVEVAFRPHPSERRRISSPNFSKIDTDSLESSIAAANCVVGHSSTVLQDSAALGIPSFYIEVNGQSHDLERNGRKVDKFQSSSNLADVAMEHFQKNYHEQYSLANKKVEALRSVVSHLRSLLNDSESEPDKENQIRETMTRWGSQCGEIRGLQSTVDLKE